jgi:hypothetical protein
MAAKAMGHRPRACSDSATCSVVIPAARPNISECQWPTLVRSKFRTT